MTTILDVIGWAGTAALALLVFAVVALAIIGGLLMALWADD